MELLFLAAKENYRVKEVPVFWKHVYSNRVSPLRDSWRMFVELVKIRWTHVSGGYNETNRVALSVDAR